jgi:hypothetical protein
VSVDEDIDELYGLRPEEFAARRKELATAAKKGGDPEAAKLISAARRPTTAAWVVNALVRADPTARPRLSELSDSLRAGHASMDGLRIRELTAAQRKLVSELVRTAFEAAAISQPTGALRDDVTGTLQAAIADPDVCERLGRLEKAEQWSGFGDFGSSVDVVRSSRREPQARTPPKTVATGEPDVEAQRSAARERRDAAAVELEAARAAHAEATEAVADRRGKLATARRRYEKLLETLSAAEHDVDAADAELEAAQQDVQVVAARVEAAVAELSATEAAVSALDSP